MRRPSLFPLLILLASLSCTRPSSDEMYVSRERAEYGDTYPFELDFSDSLQRNDLAFFMRLERKPFDVFPDDTLALCLRWIAPSSEFVQDTVVLDLRAYADSSYSFRDFVFPFREDFRPAEYGTWRLKVRIPDAPEQLSGLGLIFKREKNGTR